MKVGVRTKLFLLSLVSIALCVAVADAVVARSVSSFLLAEIREDLLVRARLVAREVSAEAPAAHDMLAWDGLADGQAEVAGARVTLLSPSGRVLGDSDLDVAALDAIESHGARPEIRDALLHGRGEGTRFSATLHEQMLYTAVPVERAGEVLGVVRLGKPLHQVDGAVASARRLVLAGSLAAVVVAVLVSLLAAQRLSGTLRELTAVAVRMTGGDLSARAGKRGYDELGELARAFDHLAETLASKLAELQGERDLLSGVLEQMKEGVLVVDREGRALTFNPALRGMLGLPEGEGSEDLVIGVRNPEIQEFVRRARDTQQPASGEVTVPSAHPKRLLVHVARMSGQDARWLVVFVDVTELRRLESLRRDFVANVSHELRTPVAAVRSAAETLSGGALDEPEAARKFVAIIERHAQRLQALIDDLLDISRIEAKELRLTSEPIDVVPFLGSVLGLFRERAERKGVLLKSRCADALALVGDARNLEHVLSNLVDNAIKYAPAGASVTLSAEAAGDALRFLVTDTGPGIEPKHLPRLFERFYRVDRGRSRDVGGTGLGLAIVKHLTEAMGGHVEVTSELGVGSTFVVWLPKTLPSGTPRSPASAPAASDA